jgi:hypothetical protein
MAKPYCNPSTSLFIDITNLQANASLISSDEIRGKSSLIRLVTELSINQNKFGSILFFYYVAKIVNARIEYRSMYKRVDVEGINKSLLDFLNEHYPIIGFWIEPAIFPATSFDQQYLTKPSFQSEAVIG